MFNRKAVILLGALAFSGAASADLNNGLMAYYPFNGNANDESGKGNNGQIMGATLTEDKLGNQGSAYSFDGISQYIQLSNSNSLNVGLNDYSIVAWIKVVSPTNNGRIFSKGSSWWSTGYMMRMNNNTVYLENSFQGGGMVVLHSSKPLADDNKWHMVVGVVARKTGAKIYIDGTLNSSQTIDTSAYDLSNTNDPMIGYNDERNFAEYFNGSIDEVRLYSRALSKTEVSALYKLVKPVGGTLQGFNSYTATCANTTTGKKVTMPVSVNPVFDCEKTGLVVNPKDNVTLTIKGNAH